MKEGARPWLDPNSPPLPPLTDSELKQIQLYRTMTPLQKWEQAVMLREMAWAIRRASLKRKHPDWNGAEVESAVREFFLHAST